MLKNDLLLEHHLQFLSLYRGRRESLPGLEFIHSEKPTFNTAIPLNDEYWKSIGREFQIYLPEWSMLQAESLLADGWETKSSIAYMQLRSSHKSWTVNPAVTVRQANSAGDIEQFSLVQGRGFLETEADFRAWHPWLREINLRNSKLDHQYFYIASLEGKDAGVCLALYHQNIAGIYAVATLPDYRKKGISTTVMQAAIDDAIADGALAVTLQVFEGSYAERFYERLGFEKVFSCSIFKLPATL